MRRRVTFLLALGALALSCAPTNRRPAASLDAAAEVYVRLALAMEKHDPDFVDSYFGSEEWRADASRDSLSLGAIRERADSLVAALSERGATERDSLTRVRSRYLEGMLRSLSFRTRILSGERFTFDEESRGLFDAVAPALDDSAFAPALARLDALLPGPGPLHERYERYRSALVVPAERVDTVFRTAVEEARGRTREHVELPDSESFRVELVRDEPWGGYNWYEGGYRSLIQVNVDLPVYVDRVLDLACHEGYPGHHVYNVLLERTFLRGYGWQEFAITPLYSPLSVVSEGTANVAPDIAFPAEERRRFEKEVLFPLAGIDTALYDRYADVRVAKEGLALARIQGSRRYLDGGISREEAVRWTMEFTVTRCDFAERSVRFDDRYRSYQINYGFGEKLVRRWLDRHGGDEASPARRWKLFEELLAAPKSPGELAVAP